MTKFYLPAFSPSQKAIASRGFIRKKLLELGCPTPVCMRSEVLCALRPVQVLEQVKRYVDRKLTIKQFQDFTLK